MAKLGSGILSGLLAAIWLLFAIGYQFNGKEAWLFANIPIFILVDYQLPRLVILFCAGGWAMGAITLIAAGCQDILALRDFSRKLQSGMTPVQILEGTVSGTNWSNRVCKLSAESIVRGKPYSKTIAALLKVSGESLDSVVLQYKLVVDILQKHSLQIQQAAAKLGISPALLPQICFPCVLVVESQKRSLRDLLTKVDLSTTNDSSPLLTAGDLVYSYNGNLVNSVERLDELVAAGKQTTTVEVGVLRYVKTSNPHPLTGISADYCWQALKFGIPGGTIEAKLENFGQPNPVTATVWN